MTSKKRTIAILLAAMLALSLLLTACGTGDDTPTGDNSTPGTSSTPGVTDTQTPTPDNTTEPDNTPDETDPSTPDTSETDTPVKKDFAWLDPSNYDMEKKAGIDELIEYYGGDEVDIDKLIEEAFAEYSEYINENITLESVRIAIVASRVPMTYRDNKNLTKLPVTSLQKVNDYLQSYGAEPLDSEDHKQDIAALAITSSLFYEENWDNAGNALYDITMAFGRAYSGANEPDEYFGVAFINRYYVE